MAFPEHFEQAHQANHTFVVHDQHGLCMTRPARADFFIGRILSHPAGIACSGGIHPLHLPEASLRAPKAAHTELHHF